ncbi:hypothetical protein B0J14DRAFT_638127 [Halenospora varia]|nr:hypothetical protein B0J14DRAFT_638127 [Halenospora varia]
MILEGKNVKFRNHHTGTTHDTSPLAGQPPSSPVAFSTHRVLPKCRSKDWDNFGKVHIKYFPQSPIKEAAAPERQFSSRLPSWVPNWDSWSPRDPEPLPSWTDSEPRYWASGRYATPIVIDHTDSRVLLIGGVVFDEVYQLSWSWSPTTKQTNWAPPSVSSQRAGRGFWETVKESVEQQNALDAIYAEYRKPRDEFGMREVFSHSKKVKKQYKQYIHRIHGACSNRALYVTRKGYMGLAPWNATTGDLVCVLSGGCTPLLLRPLGQSGRYKFVGETYVSGIMRGGVFENKMGPLEEKIFEII